MGGVVPFPDEIHHEIQRIAAEPLSVEADPREEWYERMRGMR
jgi:hypothetical protein